MENNTVFAIVSAVILNLFGCVFTAGRLFAQVKDISKRIERIENILLDKPFSR